MYKSPSCLSKFWSVLRRPVETGSCRWNKMPTPVLPTLPFGTGTSPITYSPPSYSMGALLSLRPPSTGDPVRRSCARIPYRRKKRPKKKFGVTSRVGKGPPERYPCATPSTAAGGPVTVCTDTIRGKERVVLGPTPFSVRPVSYFIGTFAT